MSKSSLSHRPIAFVPLAGGCFRDSAALEQPTSRAFRGSVAPSIRKGLRDRQDELQVTGGTNKFSAQATIFGAASVMAWRWSKRRQHALRLASLVARRATDPPAESKAGSAPPAATPPADAASSLKDDLEKAKAAAELAKLELEAAKIRAEVNALEESNNETRRKKRAEDLMARVDGSWLSQEDLKTALDEELGLRLSDEQAAYLITAVAKDKTQSALSVGDLASKTFDVEVAKLTEMKQQEKFRAEQAAQAQETSLRAAAAMEESGPVVDEEIQENTDTATRLLGGLAYFYTLSQALPLAIPLLQTQPILLAFFAPITLVAAVLAIVPFGPIICMFGMTIAAQSSNLPRLLRFNLEQAVLLTIALILPELITASAGASAPIVGFSLFAIYLLISIYCVITTAGGKEPDALPGISDLTKFFIQLRNER